MNSSISKNTSITQLQRIILLLSAFILTVILFLVRGGMNSKAPLDQLARQSLNPEIALSNGRPTILEFYADWCEACREMAPAMLNIENEVKQDMNIVLLNVENNLWQDLIDKYEVNGIPKLIFFNSQGDFLGSSTGLKNYEKLKEISTSLLNEQSLPSSIKDGKVSDIRVIS